MIFAIDPGNEYSAYVLLNNDLSVIEKGKVLNHELIEVINRLFYLEAKEGYLSSNIEHVAIEMIASYGMAVGKTVFDTCVWIGRFYQAIYEQSNIKPTFIYRKDEKMLICGNMKAKDSNIRQALIDRFAKHDFKNGKGTKKNPDWFYGFKADVWAAYAVAVTYHDLRESDESEQYKSNSSIKKTISMG
ncbi:hypothetical protein [Beduini sp.]|uniref:hypothetical protein n=1 Tax=Beduini sp. TaxID=1922300 RepID=UPI0039A3C5DE